MHWLFVLNQIQLASFQLDNNYEQIYAINLINIWFNAQMLLEMNVCWMMKAFGSNNLSFTDICCNYFPKMVWKESGTLSISTAYIQH